MVSRNKLTMCRLCLSENVCFIDIFEFNECQGYVAAEAISDLLKFQVSETDGYPHVVCSKCFVKLTDFKLFKECCLKSKVTYDSMLVSSESLDECQPEMLEFVTVKAEPIFYLDKENNISQVTIKSEEVIIDSSPVSDDPLIETEVNCGPILLMYEVLPFRKDNHRQEADHDGSDLELGEQHPLKDASSDVKLTALETVTHPQYPQCLDHKKPHCTSKGEIDGGSCAWSISIHDKPKNITLCEDVDASSSGTMEKLDKQRILQGESINKVALIQQDISIGKDVQKVKGRMEENIGEGWRRTGPEKEVLERREGLECFHCGTVLLSKHSLIKHMKVHGFVNSYECAICGKVFRINYNLKRHVMTHTGSRPYKCAECGKCFSQNGNLRAHMRTHTASKPHICTECGKIFTQSSSLNIHVRSHTGFKPCKCVECGKSFTRNHNLIVHMRSHTGYKPHECAECCKRFSHNSNLKRHMKTHTGSKPYKCAICCKCFSQNGNLQAHMRTHTASKPHICTERGKIFTQSSSLNIHKRSHTGFKPCKCVECGKSFTRNHNLIVHMRSHTGYKPHECAECCKRFSHNSNLKRHMKTHTGSKPYKCAICCKCFSQNGNLKTHMQSHRF